MLNDLGRRLSAEEIGELVEYFQAASGFSGVALTYEKAKLDRIHANLREAGAINQRHSKTMQRNAMRETRKELRDILAMYAKPDGSCK